MEDRFRKSEGRYFHQRFTRSNICKYKKVSMRLVSLHMRGSVARNYIFSLIWRCYGPKQGYFGLLGNNIVYYLIMSYLRIKVYRVETMDMGRSYWNTGVIGTFIISISTTVLIVRYKIHIKAHCCLISLVQAALW